MRNLKSCNIFSVLDFLVAGSSLFTRDQQFFLVLFFAILSVAAAAAESPQKGMWKNVLVE